MPSGIEKRCEVAESDRSWYCPIMYSRFTGFISGFGNPPWAIHTFSGFIFDT